MERAFNDTVYSLEDYELRGVVWRLMLRGCCSFYDIIHIYRILNITRQMNKTDSDLT